MTRLPVISLAMLSATALAYELLLMRLFSIIYWHHFAYMVIGLALLIFVLLMFVVFPQSALFYISLSGLFAAIIAQSPTSYKYIMP